MFLYIYHNYVYRKSACLCTHHKWRVSRPRHLCAESIALAVFMFGTSGVAAVNLFLCFPVLAVYMRWCCLECEWATSKSSSLVCADLVHLWAGRGVSVSRLRCGTSCTWALWKTTRADTWRRCSSDVTCAGCWCSSLSTNHRARRCTATDLWMTALDNHVRAPDSIHGHICALYRVRIP